MRKVRRSYDELFTDQDLSGNYAKREYRNNNSKHELYSTTSHRVAMNTETEPSEKIYRKHLFETFQCLRDCRTLPPVSSLVLQEKAVYLPTQPGYGHRKTIIFDLDETLVHSVDNPCMADVVVPIVCPSGKVVKTGFNIRPYALECLKKASESFEVLIFTASSKPYADGILDYLDPYHDIIHHRLYRGNCLLINGMHIKDLRILLGRKLENMVIVDNAVHSFAYQLNNGIPIIPWTDDRNDRELFNLMDYLKRFKNTRDVRIINQDVFGLESFYEDYVTEFCANQEYNS